MLIVYSMISFFLIDFVVKEKDKRITIQIFLLKHTWFFSFIDKKMFQ